MKEGALATSPLLEHPDEESRRHAARSTLREFWLHQPTGYVWALESDRAGRVIAASGPLAVSDAVPALLDYLLYRAREVPWIVRHRQEFTALHRGG